MKNYFKAALCTGLTFASLSLFAQEPGWHLKNLKQDNIFGISLNKAYEQLKGKKSITLTVAILDSGIDTLHEDLKEVLWINRKEKAANGKDDDKNGYTDDKYGWGFIGGKSANVGKDNLELTRLIRRGDGKTNPSLQATFDKEKSEAQRNYDGFLNFKNTIDTMFSALGIATPVSADIETYQPKTTNQIRVKQALVQGLKAVSLKDFISENISGALSYYKDQLDYNYNLNFDPRPLVGDDYNNSKQHNYGNNDVMGVDAHHGTHVAGIVGAMRNNNLGLQGVADNVRLIAVRVVPDGDERDKDVASGIRYAVDNGAKVINMSFGKGYSWDKLAVDEAAKYAASKDVLLIQAAGNSAENIDSVPNFPNRNLLDGNTAENWLVVGASGPNDDATLAADFSNYGKTSVDLFAPGVQIYSSVPGSKYAKFNGTSMAAPVVAGIAALIRSYYPKLSAVQVKDILMKSVTKVSHPVRLERNGKKVNVDFTDLCISGGIVNAAAALKLASEYRR